MKTDSGIGPNKALYTAKPGEYARGCAMSPIWNDRGKPHSTNGFAYAKTGDQAAAIGTKGNKRRR
jgi:hypothetical protein